MKVVFLRFKFDFYYPLKKQQLLKFLNNIRLANT